MTDLAPTTPRIDPHLPYLADGPISATMGLVLVFAAVPLTELAGWSLPPAFFVTLGVFLLPWAAFNLLLGRVRHPPTHLVWANIAVDCAWALGSLVLVALYWNELSPMGIALLLAQAVAVAGMFAAKLLGVRDLLG